MKSSIFFIVVSSILHFCGSLSNAADLAVGVPVKSNVLIALVSIDATKAKVIQTIPIVEETYNSHHLSSAISSDNTKLLYALGDVSEREVKLFNGNLKTVGISSSPVFLVPRTNKILLQRMPPVAARQNMLPTSSWATYDISTEKTVTVFENEPTVMMVQPYFGTKIVGIKMSLERGFGFEPVVYDLSNNAVVSEQRKKATDGEIASDPSGTRAALLTQQCALRIISESNDDEFKIPSPDYYCRTPVWNSNEELLLSASPLGGSSYGSSYSVKSFDLNSHQIKTLIQGDSHIFYLLRGRLANGDLVVMGHGLDRTPTYTLELFDSSGKRKNTLFGSQKEISFFGELEGYSSQLENIEENSPLGSSKKSSHNVKTDAQNIRAASEQLLERNLGHSTATFHSTLLLTLESKDKYVRQKAIQELEYLPVSSSKKIPDYIKLLRDSDSSIRAQAVFALGKLGQVSAPAIDTLLELLYSTDQLEQSGIILTVSKIEISDRTEKVIQNLKKIFNDTTVRGMDSISLYEAAKRFGPRAALLSDNLVNDVNRLAVPKECFGLNNMMDVPVLDAAVAVGTAETKQAVQNYVSKSLPVFLKCVHRADNDMTYSDAEALHYITAFKEFGGAAVPTLISELSSEQPSVNGTTDLYKLSLLKEALDSIGTNEAKEALRKYAEKLRSNLQKSTTDFDSLNRLSSLGQYAVPAIPDIVGLLNRPGPQQTVIHALSEINTTQSRNALIKIAQEKRYPSIFQDLAKGKFEISELPLITLYSRDSDIYVRSSARDALAKLAIDDEEALISERNQRGFYSAERVESQDQIQKNGIEFYKRWKSESTAHPDRYPVLTKMFSAISANEPFLFPTDASFIQERDGYLRGETGVEKLFSAMSGSEPRMAQSAAAALPFTGISPEKVVPRLIKLLKGSGGWLGTCAVTGLGGFANNSKVARAALDAAKNNPDYNIKTEAERQVELLAKVKLGQG